MIALILLSSCLFLIEGSNPNLDVSFFDVKPNGKLFTHKRHWNDYVCVFSFKVMGGTDENWTMEIADKDNYVECSVGRGKASYLFFESFLMNIDGPRVNAIEHYTAHSSGVVELDKDEVIFDGIQKEYTQIYFKDCGKMKSIGENRVTVSGTDLSQEILHAADIESEKE